MSVVLGLLAALSYGISDFLGGIASRRVRPVTVLLYIYPIGAIAMLALVGLAPGHVGAATLAWSAAGGLWGMLGVLLMYSAMATAPLNVVSPLTATSTAAVPVLAGVLSGERPGALAWIGIALGFAAIALVSRSPDDAPEAAANPADLPRDGNAAAIQPRISTRAVVLALCAGIGFGGYFLCLARAGDDSGLWPVVISRIVASLLAVGVAWRAAALTTMPRTMWRLVIAAGILDASANAFFLLASREGYLSLAGVLTSLYPAATVTLAIVVLRERVGAAQRLGFVLALAAILLLTVS